MLRIIPFAHKVASEYLKQDSTIVDATCGNGNDTIFLYKLVPNGHVYAFDIQSKAIENTKKRIKSNNVSVINDSHENISNYVNNVDLVMFNLGYLPNSNSNITTTHQVTIRALENILPILNRNGLVIIVVYTGHENGMLESIKLEGFIDTLSSEYSVSKYEILNKKNPPYVLIIKKNR
ncbi:class I SAM-dependent methyltransferase [Mycoplasmatota bacterium zrk1]